MTRQRWLIGAGAASLAVLVVLLFRGPEPATVAAAPAPEEHSFDKHSALKVTMRGPVLHFEYLSDPLLNRLGGRAFLLGRRVSTTGTQTWVYLPIDEVSYIEEYTSVEGMIKAHPHLAPKKVEAAKPEGMVVAPDVPPKKN